MKYVVGLIFTVSFCLAASFTARASEPDESCECPKLACDACSFQQGVTFFTSKCGPAGARLKSCARPTCLPVDQATKECPVPPAAGSKAREPVVVAAAVNKADPNADIRLVGKVKVISGSVSITHADGKKSQVTGESQVAETDTVESAEDGTALVTFDGGNKMHVHPKTALQVKEYRDQGDPSSRKALLQLIKGRIRSQVEQKYNGKTSYFRVITTAAVAGVRGTDFVMEHGEDGKLETRVETIGGRVMLASLDEREMRDILRGEGAVFSADLPDPSFKGTDYSEFIQRGKLSPVYKIPSERMRELELETRVDIAKSKLPKKKPKEVEICSNPKGFLDQCSWKCTGNPAGEKTCRVDIQSVSCIRSRCNANGKWAEETKLSDGTACPPTGERVKPCDY